MRIMAFLTPKPDPGGDGAAFERHLVAEERAVWAAYRAGTLREMDFQPDPTAVTLVFEAADPRAVEVELAAFPMVRAGLLDVRTVALGPWLPLEALFERQHRT